MGNRRSRLRYSNRTKVLLCYLAAFGLPVLWMLAGFFWGYPYKLAGSAPHIAETLLGLFPGQARLTAAASAAEHLFRACGRKIRTARSKSKAYF